MTAGTDHEPMRSRVRLMTKRATTTVGRWTWRGKLSKSATRMAEQIDREAEPCPVCGKPRVLMKLHEHRTVTEEWMHVTPSHAYRGCEVK